jgi:hypothetical protein
MAGKGSQIFRGPFAHSDEKMERGTRLPGIMQGQCMQHCRDDVGCGVGPMGEDEGGVLVDLI